MTIAREIDGFWGVVVAVRNLDEAIANYQKIGFQMIDRSARETWGLEAAQFKVGDGGAVIELISPVSEDKDVAKVVRKFLDQRGEGVYEVAVNVADIDAVNRHVNEQGVRTLGAPMPVPVPAYTHRKLMWISPKSTNGVFLEFMTSDPKFERIR
jgi:methylmalonyl-CoA epimerase